MSAIDLPPALETPRLRLRALDGRDVDALFGIFSDPDMMRFWSTPPLQSRSEAEAMLERIRRGYAERSAYQWGVERRADARLLGTCSLFQIQAASARAEIGYALASAHWRQGYMTEAVRALVDHAFGPMRLRRLEADVDPRNASSLKLVERLGFRREGLLRERWDVGGELQDSLLLGLLAREWQEARASAIRIVPWDPALGGDFRRLNLEWIERLFTVEAADLEVLDDPLGAIVAPGGMIYFALDGQTVVGTAALLRAGEGRGELAKMAVAPGHQRRGIGERLGAACLRFAAENGVAAVYLETNSRLENAIRLYERLGFRRKPWPYASGYARGDTYMELEPGPARS